MYFRLKFRRWDEIGKCKAEETYKGTMIKSVFKKFSFTEGHLERQIGQTHRI
jgi:hypothetical protein